MNIRTALMPLALLALLAACGGASDVDAPSTTTTTTKATKAAKPKFDKAGYAEKIQKAFVEANTRPIQDSCGLTDPTSWQCFYDHVSADRDSRIDITLAFPGDVTKGQAKDLAKQARLAFFNFVGEQFPKLDTIVTYDSTGRDIGTTRRDQVPLLNR
jgi:hypothetical protein